MNVDPALLFAAPPAVLFAGVAKGGFGGAAAFAATPLLSLAIPVRDAVGLMLPLLIVMDATALWSFWGRWAQPDARALCLWLIVGGLVGWALFDSLSAGALQLGVGCLALAFVAFRFAQTIGWRPRGPSAFRMSRTAVWGAAAGLTSFVAHAGGPPVAMLLIPRGLDKTAYQATVVIAFAVVNLVKVPPYVSLGLIRWETLAVGAILAPVAFLGIKLGVWLHRRVRQETFERVVILGLVLAGLKLARDGWLALG